VIRSGSKPRHSLYCIVIVIEIEIERFKKYSDLNVVAGPVVVHALRSCRRGQWRLHM
jgi:hypothetical protein